MRPLSLLTPLLVAAGFLLAGNGLQATLVALRAGQEGFPATLIGLMGTTYYLGYIAATFLAPGLIRGVGHIRVFAALASVAACGTLLLSLVVEPVPWVMIRCVMGFCFCGLFMVIESWLNDTADNTNRARILSIYRLVDFGAVTGIQFLLPVFGTTGFEIFAVTTLLFCVSLVPVSLSERCNPIPPAAFRFDIGLIWRISPLACMGCLTIGLTTSAFRLVGPFYATEIGLDVTGVAIFMSAGLLGGAIFQYPMGWLSDRIDRRWVVIAATAGATLAGIALSTIGGIGHFTYIGVFLFGAFALPLHSLSIAHANDRAEPGQFVVISAGLLFFFAIGSTVGPATASVVIEVFGPSAFFAYTSAAHASLLIVSAARLAINSTKPKPDGGRFVRLVRNSPAIVNLAVKAMSRPRPD